MPGVKTNERPGTRAVLRQCRTSAYKIRPVLDLIRGQDVERAREILRFSERDAAHVVGKLLASAVANAENNDGLDPEELYVSACYADEGATMKRWRPRARGRATRIRKRSCHITVVVSRLPEHKLARLRAKQAADARGMRARRVAGGRQGRRARRDEQMPGTAPPPVTEPEATPSGPREDPGAAGPQPEAAAEEPTAAPAEAATTEPAVDEHGEGTEERNE